MHRTATALAALALAGATALGTAAAAEARSIPVAGSASCTSGVRVVADDYGRGERLLAVRVDGVLSTTTLHGDRGRLIASIPSGTHSYFWGVYNPRTGNWRTDHGSITCG